MTDHDDARDLSRMTWPRRKALLAAVVVLLAAILSYAFCDHGRAPPPKPKVAKAPVEETVDASVPKPEKPPPGRPDVLPVLTVPPGTPDPVPDASMRTVAIKEEASGDLLGYGTGFLFDDRLILTAAHNFWGALAAGRPSITVYCDGRPSPARIIRRNDDLDVAVLYARECRAERLKFATASDDPAATHYATGYQYDAKVPKDVTKAVRFFTATKPVTSPLASSICRAMRWEMDGKSLRPGPYRRSRARYVVFDRALRPGNSGAPLFDAHGRVVGMFTLFEKIERKAKGLDSLKLGGIDDGDEGISCFVTADELLRVVRGLR